MRFQPFYDETVCTWYQIERPVYTSVYIGGGFANGEDEDLVIAWTGNSVLLLKLPKLSRNRVIIGHKA